MIKKILCFVDHGEQWIEDKTGYGVMNTTSNDEERLFCDECGVQLLSIMEINRGLCDRCWMKKNLDKKEEDFTCKICNKELISMEEIAQGICKTCKIGILKKLKK